MIASNNSQLNYNVRCERNTLNRTNVTTNTQNNRNYINATRKKEKKSNFNDNRFMFYNRIYVILKTKDNIRLRQVDFLNEMFLALLYYMRRRDCSSLSKRINDEETTLYKSISSIFHLSTIRKNII